MIYNFDGQLCGYICPEINESVANAEVRLYHAAVEPQLAARVSARPKETTAIIDEQRVEEKSDRLLATTETDAEGNFLVELDDDQHDYDGEAFELDVRLDSVPGEHDPEPDPVQVTVTTLQPQWRKAEEGATFSWEYCFSKEFWCSVRTQFGGRVICGQVTFCDSDDPVNDVTVRAFDGDIIEDDPLGSDVATGAGYFVIYYHRDDYVRTPLSPFLNVEIEHGPDLYFTVEASDGTPLLEEDRADGRQPGREDAGVCAHITDLCLPAPDDGQPGEDFTTTLWTGVGTAFDVPTDFTPDGYAASGSTEYALTRTVHLTGSTPLRNADGNPVEYRFRISDTTAQNDQPPLSASEFASTGASDDRNGPIGIGNNANTFGDTKIGKAMVLESATSRLVPIEVVAQRTDLDPDGWLNVDAVLNRALSDAGYTRSDLRYWDDVDTLMRLNTNDLAAPDSSPPTPDSGQSVDISADGFTTHRFALRFEARDAATGDSMPGSGQTMNRLVMDNNSAVASIELKKTSRPDPCKPVSGQLALAYTAYHPHIDWVRLNRQRNESSPGKIRDSASDSTKAPLDQDVAGGPQQVYSYDGTGDPDDVANHFDITPGDTCNYIVWMRTRRRLHTGRSQVSASRTRLIPFYYEA